MTTDFSLSGLIWELSIAPLTNCCLIQKTLETKVPLIKETHSKRFWTIKRRNFLYSQRT
ncbi:hypothetical protein COMA2_190002 [Candidatus Nitrospira nitrificans]|uniref:Uncharacterized protein n=1 Tax=Candidatus Nitrospira nitrificans TaxID=1742973 RepID=A0A0S4LC62_9BACT|nr:hypothetical protein COMA2_190002 [Candidatus Nitrospira nitrificans]